MATNLRVVFPDARVYISDDVLVYAIYQHQDLADIAWMMSKVMPILLGVHFVIWGKWLRQKL